MYYAYILRSLRDRKLYIGYTEDLQRRFSEHQHGLSDATAPRRPFELLFYEAFTCPDDAKRREAYFKSTKGRWTLRQMLRHALEVRE